MVRALRVCPGKNLFLFCCPMVLGLAASVHADPKPLTKEEQAKIDKAIDKGVAFRKRTQTKEGAWPASMRGNFRLGQTLLMAYALLESDVPVNDSVIQKVAEYVRPRVLKLDHTYEIALAVLFLDRLGDPKDKPLIHSLGLRLIAGQHVTGGWNYRCPIMSKQNEEILSQALDELQKRQEAGEKSSAKLLKGLELPRSLRALVVFRDQRNLPWKDPRPSKENEYTVHFVGTTDNSNTQFAMLGLWVARRHDVPVGPTFRLVVERFERSQQANGWWSYPFFEEQSDRTVKHPSMLCAGLMGLAIGRGLKLPTPGVPQPGMADLPMLKGLAALSQDIGIAITRAESVGSSRGVYYLWSVERVAMLYDLPTIGDKDWYRWGATMFGI